MNVLSHVWTVRNSIILPPVRAGMGVDGVCRHLIRPHLRRLHELVVGGQRCDTPLGAECVGAVHDVLFHGIYIGSGSCNLRLRYRLVSFHLCGCFTGVGTICFDLHRSVLGIPINIEADRLADVTELEVVVSVDVVRFDLNGSTVEENRRGAALCEDTLNSLCRRRTKGKA